MLKRRKYIYIYIIHIKLTPCAFLVSRLCYMIAVAVFLMGLTFRVLNYHSFVLSYTFSKWFFFFCMKKTEYSKCMNSSANILSLYEPSSICVYVSKIAPKPLNNYLGQYHPKDNRKEHRRWYTSVKSTINHQATSTTNDKEEKKKLIVHAGCCYRLEGAEWDWKVLSDLSATF